MDSEIYKFNKPFEVRLTELKSVFDYPDTTPSLIPEISRIWSDYLEISVEPCGWKALWYISRKCCGDLKIVFPAIVVVMVDYIDFGELTANVTIVEVEDAEEMNALPTKVNDVPLKELYVTLQQDYQGPDFNVTAENLDQFRFFYNHLWWPWDDEDGRTESWLASHLESRLKLFYDILNGNMHYVTAKTIKQLIERGKEVYNEMENLQTECDDTNHDEELLNDALVVKMVKLTNELDSIKVQLSRWENIELRKALNADIIKKYVTSGITIVINECSISEAAKCSNQTAKYCKETELFKRTTSTLREALLHYIKGDKIFIDSSTQSVHGCEHLGYNVTIKGLYDDRMPTIKDSRSHWCLFESIADNVIFENLIIEVQSSRSAITVRGVTCLNSVFLRSTNKSAINAIVVYPQGSLIATNCSFENFNVAISCMDGAAVNLINCVFRNNDVCVKIGKGGEMVIENGDFDETNNTAIHYKDGSAREENLLPLDFLNGIEGFSLSNVKVPNPEKAVRLTSSIF